MDNKLFDPVTEAHDAKNRQVFICKDAQGFHVYKPATGFKSKSWATDGDEALKACFERQIADSQRFASYEPGEKAEGFPVQVKSTGHKVVVK
jgi:hypothetical protein